jgi:CRISPR-associated protein Cas2
MQRKFYVLAYDIADDRRRLRIAKEMEAVGERVQGSVFEAWLSDAELDKLLKRVKKVLREEEDSLRIYTLCEACRGKARTEGQSALTPPPRVQII